MVYSVWFLAQVRRLLVLWFIITIVSEVSFFAAVYWHVVSEFANTVTSMEGITFYCDKSCTKPKASLRWMVMVSVIGVPVAHSLDSCAFLHLGRRAVWQPDDAQLIAVKMALPTRCW